MFCSFFYYKVFHFKMKKKIKSTIFFSKPIFSYSRLLNLCYRIKRQKRKEISVKSIIDMISSWENMFSHSWVVWLGSFKAWCSLVVPLITWCMASKRKEAGDSQMRSKPGIGTSLFLQLFVFAKEVTGHTMFYEVEK